MIETPYLLIVDDSPTQSMRLRLELEAQSWQVDAVGTAEEALARLEAALPAVLLINCCLPGISGDDLCRHVRMNFRTCKTPMIMLVGDDHAEAEMRRVENGADDFFKKSENIDILVSQISHLLERSNSTNSSKTPHNPTSRAARVLAVDDSATYLLHLKCLLEAEGYVVDAVSDPTQALTNLKSSSYDLALIDLVMPKIDGIDLCRQIVSMRLTLDNPIAVLMLTGREAKEDLTRALEAGADDFVGKSSDQAVLIGRIRALLRRKFFQEENQRILEELKNQQLQAISTRAETEAALARASDERRQHAESVAVDLQKAKADLERSNEELLRSNDELRQFAFVASHDLQEPLRSITSFCNLLKEDYEGQIDEQADAIIARIVNGAKRMKALITDLLAYSRVDSHQSSQFQDVEMRDVLEDVTANLQTTITEASAEIICDCLPVVRGDRVQLVQLLQNLLGNAIMYRGDQTPKIEISAIQCGDTWQISVRDNGIGIAPEYHQQIFEIFRRLHSRDKYPGTGIGLASCKKIVQRLGGQITLDSQPGSGSTFRFTIPAALEEPIHD